MKYRFLFIFILVLFVQSVVFSSDFANDEYTIPIDYSKIDKNALESQANQLFDNYEKITNKEIKQKYLQPLLNRYSVLSNMDPSDSLYITRLAILYGDMGNNIYAKSCFYRATNVNPKYKYAHYAFGNYYYNQGFYRKAIKEYNKASGINFPYSYDRFMKVGSIYERLGNYLPALDAYKSAYQEQNTFEAHNKILLLEDLSSKKVLYH